MHAVVFQIDVKQDHEGDPEAELETLARRMKSTPGFVRGTWVGDGKRGLSLLVFESEAAAQALASSAKLPPDTAATLRSVDVYEVVAEA